MKATDIAVNGGRGSIYIERLYRSGSQNNGPFGVGTGHNYAYALNTQAYVQQDKGVIWLQTPDQNQFAFNQQSEKVFTNSSVPGFAGAVLRDLSNGEYSLRWRNGMTYHFRIGQGPLAAFLDSITDPNGNTVKLTWDNGQPLQITQITDPVNRSLNLTYDGSNRITSITDPIGRRVEYTYDGQGNLASVKNAGGFTTKYEYDSNHNLKTITNARGIKVSQFTYDANNRVTQIQQPDGGVISISYVLLNPDAPETSPVSSATVTDPMQNQSVHRFDPTGLVTDMTDPVGQIRNIERDDGRNNRVKGFKGNGFCKICPTAALGDLAYSLDEAGNITTTTDALGNATALTYESSFNKVTSVTDPLQDTTQFTYDSSGNLLSSTDPNGHTTKYDYNHFGQIIRITDALQKSTTFDYDEFGNLTAVTTPLGNTHRITYDAVSRPVQALDALNRKTTTTYDPLDRVTSQIDAKGNTTKFEYDEVGNLTKLTDARGKVTQFSYDGFNRLVSRTDPLGKSDKRTYDKNGNLIEYVDRRGQKGTFEYDSLNRLVKESYSDASVVARSYDSNGRLIHAVDTAAGTFDFSYDADGRQLASAGPFGTVRYTYDKADRIKTRQVVGHDLLDYEYDQAGNLLSTAMGNASAGFKYDADNRLQTITRGNGVTSTYSYDADGRLTSILHSGGQGINIPITYSYDAAGNRITQGTAVGQPLATEAVVDKYDDANRLLSSGATSYSYDDNGNLISAIDNHGTITYSWDSRNRLVSIQSPTQKDNVTYDIAGSLIARAATGKLNLSQQFILDGLTNLAFVGQSSGDDLSVLAGDAIDQHLAVVHSGGRVEYGLSDGINSTVATVDNQGVLVSSFLYEPFGKTTSPGGYLFQFTGRVPLSGDLYYNRARFYNASVGRFVSEDPIGFFGGDTNLYSYVFNSPSNFGDSGGLFVPQVVAGLVGAAFIAYELYPWVKSVADHYRIEHRIQDNLIKEDFDTLSESQTALACQNHRIEQISIITPLTQKVTFTPTLGGAAAYDIKMMLNAIMNAFKKEK